MPSAWLLLLKGFWLREKSTPTILSDLANVTVLAESSWRKEKTKLCRSPRRRKRIPETPWNHSRKRFFSRFLSSLSISLFPFLSLANQRIAVHWEWKFGTINSNGAYVLGDLLLGSLLAPSPRVPASSTETRSSPDWIQWLPSSSYLLDAFQRSASAQQLQLRTQLRHARPLSGDSFSPFPRFFILVHHNSVKFVRSGTTANWSIETLLPHS